MDCTTAVVWMHDYLDNDLSRQESVKLKEHLLACRECRERFRLLEQAEAYAASVMHDGLARDAAETGYDADALRARIMSGLPAQRRRGAWTRWVRNHPAVSVAALFAIVMVSSFVTMWEQDSELVVRGSDLAHVVIEGNTVIVPEGTEYDGDLTVENGTTVVNGQVNGNLTVIDGSLNMASTAKIIGQERTINQALGWIWYKVTETVNDIAS